MQFAPIRPCRGPIAVLGHGETVDRTHPGPFHRSQEFRVCHSPDSNSITAADGETLAIRCKRHCTHFATDVDYDWQGSLFELSVSMQPKLVSTHRLLSKISSSATQCRRVMMRVNRDAMIPTASSHFVSLPLRSVHTLTRHQLVLRCLFTQAVPSPHTRSPVAHGTFLHPQQSPRPKVPARFISQTDARDLRLRCVFPTALLLILPFLIGMHCFCRSDHVAHSCSWRRLCVRDSRRWWSAKIGYCDELQSQVKSTRTLLPFAENITARVLLAIPSLMSDEWS